MVITDWNLTDNERLGYRLLLGANPPPLSYNATERALRAAHLHAQRNEVNLYQLGQDALAFRRASGGVA